jgi:hypothetical protein
MELFGIGTRVVAPFKDETVTGVVTFEAYDHETGQHSLNIATDEPRVSPVTGRQYASTQVDGTQARREAVLR